MFLILGLATTIGLTSASYASPIHHDHHGPKPVVHHKQQPHFKHKSNIGVHVHHDCGPHHISYGYHNHNNGVVGGIVAGAVVGGILGAIIN